MRTKGKRVYYAKHCRCHVVCDNDCNTDGMVSMFQDGINYHFFWTIADGVLSFYGFEYPCYCLHVINGKTERILWNDLTIIMRQIVFNALYEWNIDYTVVNEEPKEDSWLMQETAMSKEAAQ